MFFLDLQRFKNLHIILTNKYLICITKNGIINLYTNFFNIFVENNKLYCNFNNYRFNKKNIFLFFINKNLLFTNNYISNKLLNYYSNYIFSIFNTLYYLQYNYITTINLNGIGYKFVLDNKFLKIRVGYSHFIQYRKIPQIYFNLLNPTKLVLYSNSKFLINKIVSEIKSYKKINLYKGTGIFYENEFIILKKKNNNKMKNAK